MELVTKKNLILVAGRGHPELSSEVAQHLHIPLGDVAAGERWTERAVLESAPWSPERRRRATQARHRIPSTATSS